MKTKFLLLRAVVASTLLFTSVAAPASDTDSRIESAAAKTYVFKTVLKDDAVKTESEDGVVTLSGTVADSAHKSLAEDTVASLPGVKSVHNEFGGPGCHPGDRLA